MRPPPRRLASAKKRQSLTSPGPRSPVDPPGNENRGVASHREVARQKTGRRNAAASILAALVPDDEHVVAATDHPNIGRLAFHLSDATLGTHAREVLADLGDEDLGLGFLRLDPSDDEPLAGRGNAHVRAPGLRMGHHLLCLLVAGVRDPGDEHLPYAAVDADPREADVRTRAAGPREGNAT